MSVLTAYVHVEGVEYAPGADVPAEVAKQITNPKAWDDAPETEQDAAPVAPEVVAPDPEVTPEVAPEPEVEPEDAPATSKRSRR